MIEVVNFQKKYGEHVVLEIPKLEIPKGLSWFKGANGSGKSTFLKALSGILPFEGNIYFTEENVDIKKEPLFFRKHINYSFAEPKYPGYLTGLEILDFHKKTKGAEFQQELMELFQVSSFYKANTETYSSGMLKKISLIASLGSPCKILALDEPFTTIDQESQGLLEKIIRQKLEQGVSVFLASHHTPRGLEGQIGSVFMVENQTILPA